MTSLTLVFAALFVVVNAALYVLVVRPVGRIAQVAERLSVGDLSAPEFPAKGAAEVTSLCWVAPRDIPPAADWAAEIIAAISAARAVHKQVQILPFRIEDVLPSKSLEYFLSSQHWMDAFPPPRRRCA
jgi:hypothetical protein